METNPTAPASATGSSIRFGHVPLSGAFIAFCHDMNREVMELLRSLPEAVHADPALFLMEHFHTPVLPKFDHLQNDHAPAASLRARANGRWGRRRPPPCPAGTRHGPLSCIRWTTISATGNCRSPTGTACSAAKPGCEPPAIEIEMGLDAADAGRVSGQNGFERVHHPVDGQAQAL